VQESGPLNWAGAVLQTQQAISQLT
jgi:hypothetical protein